MNTPPRGQTEPGGRKPGITQPRAHVLADPCSLKFYFPQLNLHFVEGYYADFEAGCQSFHICIAAAVGGGGMGGGGAVLAPHTFLCPNGTVFDQDGFMCDWWFNVECGGGGRGAQASTVKSA